MMDLEHCLILGSESIDSNSLNRCICNLYTKMGEFNSSFINSSSENIPESPFFSGGYDNILDVEPYKSLGAAEATESQLGLVKRLYNGDVNIQSSTDNDSFITDSVTGAFSYNINHLKDFAPTVDSLMREESPLVLKSFVEDEVAFTTAVSAIGSISSPTIKHTSYLITDKTGVSFGTITFKRNNGDHQNNVISIDIITDLIGIDGVDTIKFFTLGNGVATGVKDVSENLDMITDLSPCNITYNSDTRITISNITKNDNSEVIRIDKNTGRILDEDEVSEYGKYIEISNDQVVLNFFVIYGLKENVLKYNDDLWCFYIVPDRDYGHTHLYNANGWAKNYYKYTFDNFEAADDGNNLPDGTHQVWEEGCVTTATDAFNGCYNATFKSLCWFSPILRYADRMFKDCSHATFDNIPTDLSNENLRNATEMFANCKSANFSRLTSINYPNSSKLGYMFSGCIAATFDSLKSLTFRGDGKRMFYNDYRATFESLESIDGNGTSFSSMFEGCDNASLESLTTIKSDVEDNYIKSDKMFYFLARPTFNGITEIGFNTSQGYDGTSMFEGCTNAEFNNLESLGSVKYGNRMFMGLDKIGDTEDTNHATFSKLKSLGNHIYDGTQMFMDDSHLSMTITSDDTPVVYGNSMFNNTSAVVFEGNLNSLITAEYMFSNTLTAVVQGSMDALKDGTYMFFNNNSADISGSIDSMENMYSMCLSTDYVHFNHVPSSASNMEASFSHIKGECLIKSWEGATNSRYCLETFSNSDNITIYGNILDGKLVDTSNMFRNSCYPYDKNAYLMLKNPNMKSVKDAENRYYASTGNSYFAFLQNFIDEPSTDKKLSFVGSVEYASLSEYASMEDVAESLLCFETVRNDKTSYYLYTTEPASGADYDETTETYTLNASSLDFEVGEVISIRKYNEPDVYGTFTKSISGDDTYTITFTKTGDSEPMFESKTGQYSENEPTPLIRTFAMLDDAKMPETWKYSSYMFYNVVQDSLLSGYDCFISPQLLDTSYMFALKERVDDDTTFANTGTLFRKMENSSIENMTAMFQNRVICDINVFTDFYSDDRFWNKSFLIPNTIVNAASAFNNTKIEDTIIEDTIEDKTIPYIYLKIPRTLENAQHMFDGYSGPLIRLDYKDNEEIYINDNIDPTLMFKDCSFYKDDYTNYIMSVPTFYMQMFTDSDFDLNNVTHLNVRNDKNFAYPYSNDRFFFNDYKILGCSSVTFSSLQTDITDWFNAVDETTETTTSIEGSYYLTVVGKKNDSETNYEMMEGANETGRWDLQMARIGNFKTSDIINKFLDSSNGTLLENCSSLSNKNNRMTCMFSPEPLFRNVNNRLGDTLYKKFADNLYQNAYTEFSPYFNKCYKDITLKNVKDINATELGMAFMGMNSATFESLTSIGTDIKCGYGAFMGCQSAKFNKLTEIKNIQYGGENTFTSRFATDDVSKFNWYGNYDNMFAYCQNATFENLGKLTLNTVYGVDTDGNDITMWIDVDGDLRYSYYIDNRRFSYRLKTINDDSVSSNTIKLELYDNYGSKLGETFNTNILVYKSNFDASYELSDMNSEKTLVITMLDKQNVEHYFTITNGKIKESPMHPETGFATYDTDNFNVSPFRSGGVFTSDEFYDLENRSYKLQASVDEESSNCTIKIVDSASNGVVAVLGTPYSFNDDDGIDRSWYSRLCYEKDGVRYITITMFMLPEGVVPDVDNIQYPDDSICYRIYEFQGNRYVDELSVIPGSIEFNSLLKLELDTDEAMSHKAFMSGMFKDCKNATFNSLTTINIPATGSCAQMFSGCDKLDFKDGDIEQFFLPVSYDGTREKYKGFFEGIHMSSVNLSSLNLQNTNLYNIGDSQEEDSTHKIIGETFFDGMLYGEESSKFDYKNGNPMVYQNAIYDLRLDSDIAQLIFDYGELLHTVNYIDMFGSVFKKIEVEDGNPVIVPAPPTLNGLNFAYWRLVNGDGEVIVEQLTEETVSYGPVTSDINAYAIYGGGDGRPIMAKYSLMDTTSSIVGKYSDSDVLSGLITTYEI